ncbi:MAG: alcohol dehydrogenase catalytic domain-containing protein [Candidatus Aminicenantes bacterium]|nr:alcohol dehydrogenase catalytic domain-containing protein [Candidatus Aminicenantes bacterium]
MKAAKLVNRGKLALLEEDPPSINSSDEVLLRMVEVGICGSDLHYFRLGAIGHQIVKYPFTIGHEGLAIVQEIGQKVMTLKPGDKVVFNPAISCLQCDQCFAGRPHTCRYLKFLGCPGELEGCLKELIVMPAQNCFPVKEDIWPLAVLVEPLAIALYAAQMAGEIKNKKVAIFGCGPIGLCSLFHCYLAGASLIIAIDKVEARLEAARRLGAHWVDNPELKKEVNEIWAAQFDLAFDCCGDQQALNQAVSILKPGGKLIIIGIPEIDQISFDPHLLRRKEITIYNVRRQNNFFLQAIEFLQKNKEALKSLITHHFPLTDIQKAFDLASNYEDGAIKVTIKI